MALIIVSFEKEINNPNEVEIEVEIEIEVEVEVEVEILKHDSRLRTQDLGLRT